MHRTSISQYKTMLEFMEQHGDLSSHSTGPHELLDRCQTNQLWKQLIVKLNNDRNGTSKSQQRWQKVWADWKNKLKKRITTVALRRREAGGDQLPRLEVTDLQRRLWVVMGADVGLLQELEFVVLNSSMLPPVSPKLSPPSSQPSTAPPSPAATPPPPPSPRPRARRERTTRGSTRKRSLDHASPGHAKPVHATPGYATSEHATSGHDTSADRAALYEIQRQCLELQRSVQAQSQQRDRAQSELEMMLVRNETRRLDNESRWLQLGERLVDALVPMAAAISNYLTRPP